MLLSRDFQFDECGNLRIDVGKRCLAIGHLPSGWLEVGAQHAAPLRSSISLFFLSGARAGHPRNSSPATCAGYRSPAPLSQTVPGAPGDWNCRVPAITPPLARSTPALPAPAESGSLYTTCPILYR